MKKYAVFALFILALTMSVASAQEEIVVTTIQNYAGLVEYGPETGGLNLELVEPGANALVYWIEEGSNGFAYGVYGMEDIAGIISLPNDLIGEDALWGTDYLGIPLFGEEGKRMVIVLGAPELPDSRAIAVNYNFNLAVPPEGAFEAYTFLCDQFINEAPCQVEE